MFGAAATSSEAHMATRNEKAVTAGAPARALALVTKADIDQDTALLALRVYVAAADAPATLKLTPLDGGAAITLTFPAGVTWEPIGAVRVWATGSTANAVVHGVPAS
jgi:hypothetical protein